MNIEKYGFTPSMIPPNAAGTPARITASHRGRFAFVCDAGSGFAHLKSSEYRSGDETYPTTGDFVLIDWQEDGESRILRTLPRKTCFTRLDPSSSGYGAQAVAANFDHVFIMHSLDRDWNLRGLERYLTLAWQSGAVPVVLLTKADCLEDHSAQLFAAEKLAIGTEAFAVSARTGYGLERLSDYLKPAGTAVFLGPSGAGKSSLVNALAGVPDKEGKDGMGEKEIMATGKVRERDGRGRHTTSHRQLILLESGAMVIDTPGMRELGMWEAAEGLERGFADVDHYLGQCRFADCRHQSEPGCAVREAIRQGELSPQRWESYQQLEAEARYAGDKAGYLREKKQWSKEVAKMRRQKGSTGDKDYRHQPCSDSFTCGVCGNLVTPENAGSQHRNHCPHCLSSVHADNEPGDRASICRGIMDPIGVWVRKNGEWAIIHRCRSCGTLSSNRIAADDNPTLLMSIAVKPLASPPFPLWQAGQAG